MKGEYINSILTILLIILGIGLGAVLANLLTAGIKESFANIADYKSDPAYKKQIKSIVAKYDNQSGARRGISEMLAATTDMPAGEQCLVNFHVLSCRFTGYLGPFENGYMDTDQAILYALKAGCRAFIFEIDYLDSCTKKGDDPNGYYPTLVIRDVNGRAMAKADSIPQKCQTDATSLILSACQSLNNYAFGTAVQNPTDPLIVVLYLLRLPPKEATGDTRLLKYYSRIAKGLAPLLDKSVASIAAGGTFSRQQQESLLLTNPITTYEGRVLFFCNSDTSMFRSSPTLYPQNEDLDYIVNLRLSYKQTQLGCTTDKTGGSFGGIETAESFLVVPTNQVENTCNETKLRWTPCLSQDPAIPVPSTSYDKLTGTYGVHTVPIQLWDTKNTFMFTDTKFKKWSYMPKPKNLRFRKPPIVVPSQPAPETNANGGILRSPE